MGAGKGLTRRVLVQGDSTIELPVVRFAPSPSGSLHIGNARTALYNYLLAKQAGGKFVLRIEDTDKERSTDESVEQILESLQWLGLKWDGVVIRQSDNSELHQEKLRKLLASGAAYWSVAAAADVKDFRKINPMRGFRGEAVAEGTPGAAIRLRVPDEGEVVIEDTIRGTTIFPNASLDDFVIARADFSPLYNFAVAVDDTSMGINHVIRGDDHLSNTSRQILIMQALDFQPPVYAHLPLINGADGKPLAKRNGAVSVQELREQGYLPSAVLNTLALLGWGFDDKTNIFTPDELIEKFSLKRVSSSPAQFDPKKLLWINKEHIRELSDADLANQVSEFLGIQDKRIAAAIPSVKEKMGTLQDFQKLAGFLLEEKIEYNEKVWRKHMAKPDVCRNLNRSRDVLAQSDSFDVVTIKKNLEDVVEELQAKPLQVLQPIRVALTGNDVSIGIFDALSLLGKEKSLQRIDAALRKLT